MELRNNTEQKLDNTNTLCTVVFINNIIIIKTKMENWEEKFCVLKLFLESERRHLNIL